MPLRSAQLKTSAQTLILMLMAIFFSELAVSKIFSETLSRLHRVEAMAFDAGILTATVGIPLSLLLLYPVRQDRQLCRSNVILLLQALAGLYAAEAVSMLLIPWVMPKAAEGTADLADSCLTTLLSAPSLWWLFTRRWRLGRRRLVPDLLQVPLTLFVLLLVMIFLADLLQELLLMHRLVVLSTLSAEVLDSFLTTICISPLLWLLVIWPLLKKVRADRARASAVLEQVNEGIISIGPDGAVRRCNPAAERIFGYHRDDLVEGPLSLLFPDAERIIEAVEKRGSGEREPEPAFYELAGRRKDGSSIALDLSLSRVVTDEGVEYLLVLRDMSERREMEWELRQSEGRFRQIFENSEEAIVFLDPGDCRIIDANATAEEMYGYPREELARGGLELVAAGRDLEMMRSLIYATMEPERLCQLETVVNRHRSGREMVVSVHGKVLDLQGAEVVWCTLRDITEQVRLEQEARNIQAGLIQANKMTSLGLLVSGVAHQINNPNGIILANAQFLARSWEDTLKVLRAYREENGDFIIGGLPFSQFDSCSSGLFEGVIDGARRINEAVTTLKDFGRGVPGALGDVDANGVAESAVSLLKHVLVRYTENFHLELAEEAPRCLGNAQQLGQVVVNLLMNACQALPGKEKGIWLTTGYDRSRSEVTITVRDQGCGITSDVAARMMEPFFTTRLDAGGTGLGLSICRSIVKEHCGELEFSSEPGQGATFVVRIPAVIPPANESATRGAPRVAPARGVRHSSSLGGPGHARRW